MIHTFPTILRTPDRVMGATDESPFRFEEDLQAQCPVQYEYRVEGTSAKVIVYPSGAPVKFLKLRFRADLSFVESVCGDEWERCSADSPIYWSSLINHRRLPWFCYLRAGQQLGCYGVKTGADCFAFWQADSHGLTLFLNLMNGEGGTDLQAPLTACEVVERIAPEGEGPYEAAAKFARLMCENPVLPKEPVFGVNNWYWAYGRITHESIMNETDYLLEMTEGTGHRPYMIIDDGWQLNRTLTPPTYIGGPWLPGEHFGDMAKTAAGIHEKGAKAGIWFRPLLTLGRIPDEACLWLHSGGQIMDPSHPYTLERVAADAARIRSWGFDLIKHDFTTHDLFEISMSAAAHGVMLTGGGRTFHDRTRTTATLMKNLYKAIQQGAGGADIIGCNVVGHLSAGIHSMQRVGQDTSGRSFEHTVRGGVNAMMRLPMNESFFLIDPDCAAFTARVSPEANLDFLEMCAITGVTTLASVTPGILTREQMKRIREIYRMADRNDKRLTIANFEKTSYPEIFECGSERRAFDWTAVYDGSRCQLSWMQ